MRRTAAAAVALALFGVVGGGALVYREVRQRLEPADPDGGSVVFTVPRGASVRRIGRELEAAGLVRDGRLFAWLARWRRLSGSLKAGEYELSPARSAEELLTALVAGRVRTYEVVIPEGFTAAQIAERLEATGIFDGRRLLELARSGEFARELGLPGPDLEGYLFPDTYRWPRDTPPEAIAGSMVERFRAAWREIEPLAARRGLGMREVVTLASIVEKETGAAEERPRIAGVFLNRLARGMRLESDPTTIYGIADFDGNLRRVHLEDATNPYNTYRIEGLPPGPICNPGSESLRAVVEPEEHDFLYFVSRNDGTHVFSRTFAEHQRAVDRFQRRRIP